MTTYRLVGGSKDVYMISDVTSINNTHHFGLYNHKNSYCYHIAILQRLHTSQTLTRELMKGYTVEGLLENGMQKYGSSNIVNVNSPLSDVDKTTFIEDAMFPVRLYASYDGVMTGNMSDEEKNNIRLRIYECLRHYYQFYETNYINEAAQHGYLPHYVMSYVFLPMIYHLFPNSFNYIVTELYIDDVNISNNKVECTSCITAQDRAFYRNEYRQYMLELFETMFPNLKIDKTGRFCATVLEVFPNENGAGGHAVTLIACYENNNTSDIVYYVIDDQSEINNIEDYYKKRMERIYKISIRDIDAKTVININAILHALCNVEKNPDTGIKRVTRYELNFGSKFTNYNGSQMLKAEFNNTGMSGGNAPVGYAPMPAPAPAPMPDPNPYGQPPAEENVGLKIWNSIMSFGKTALIVGAVVLIIIILIIVLIIRAIVKAIKNAKVEQGITLDGEIKPIVPKPDKLEGTPNTASTDAIPPAQEQSNVTEGGDISGNGTPNGGDTGGDAGGDGAAAGGDGAAAGDNTGAPATGDGAAPTTPPATAAPPADNGGIDPATGEVTKERVLQVMKGLREKNPQFKSCWDGVINEIESRGMPKNDNAKWIKLENDGALTLLLKDGKTIMENLNVFCEPQKKTVVEDPPPKFKDEATAQKFAQYADCLTRLPRGAQVDFDGRIVVYSEKEHSISSMTQTIDEWCAEKPPETPPPPGAELAPLPSGVMPVPTKAEGFRYKYIVV